MFSFVLETIGVSILVSILATWAKLIPRYPKKEISSHPATGEYGLTQCFSYPGVLFWSVSILDAPLRHNTLDLMDVCSVNKQHR